MSSTSFFQGDRFMRREAYAIVLLLLINYYYYYYYYYYLGFSQQQVLKLVFTRVPSNMHLPNKNSRTFLIILADPNSADF